MQTTNQSSDHYFKTIQIIHAVLVLGVLIFLGMIGLNNFLGIEFSDVLPADVHIILLVTALLSSFVGIGVSSFFYKKRLAEILKMKTLKNKLGNYRSLLLVRYVLVEGPAMFCVVTLMLTNRLEVLPIIVIPLGYLIYIRPTKDNIITELSLDYKEMEELKQISL